ncbi:hypothetical protein KAW80_01925 [Candidatus Babeliales bacterium]|nr:hypothetical protein [Candidatus Babeliales bacterium]
MPELSNFASNDKILRILKVFIVITVIILSRLFYLQIYKGSAFYTRGESNFLRMEVLDSPRGNVLDCNGHLLATNRPVFDLYWEGRGNKYFNKDQENIINKTFEILGKRLGSNEKWLSLRAAEKFSRRIKIKEDLSFEQLSQISEQCATSPNLVMVNHFKRTYPYNTMASHVLGYLSKPEKAKIIGRYGLEKILQENLEGKKGYVLHVINSTGKKLEQKEEKQAVVGGEIKLTIDRDMQMISESLFDVGHSGVFIIIDPEDGAIKTLVSYPNFNPNLFVETVSEESWDELSSKNSPFLNRAITALYPPASLFKLVTFTAGLEEEIVKEDSEFNCKGFIRFCGRKYNCIRRAGHGVLSSRDAIAYSCNIPCYEIAQNIKIDQIADYATRFGLGRSTGFAILDKKGLVPTREWKMLVKHENWWKGETLSACIGQSYLLVTPLQMARMISSIYTGHLVKPRILLNETIEKESLAIKKETLLFLQDAMGAAVKFGSSRRLRSLKDYKIYAKTGTAQTASLSKAQLEHGWFACHFSYKNEKPLVLISLIEHVGTALPTLLMAKKFFEIYSVLRIRDEKSDFLRS